MAPIDYFLHKPTFNRIMCFSIDDYENEEIQTLSAGQIEDLLKEGKLQRVALKDCKQGDKVWMHHDGYRQIEIIGNLIDNNGKVTDQVAYREVGPYSLIHTVWENVICYKDLIKSR